MFDSLISFNSEAQTVNIPWDKVYCDLKVEKDIQSDTVRVYVLCTLSVSGSDSGRIRPVLDEALANVLDGKWQFASIERAEDKSGLERVVVIATIRVKEHHAGGLVDRLKQASRAGLQLTLQRLLTRPPRADVDKARLELRRRIYEQALQEAATLNEVCAGESPWRVGGIRVQEQLHDAEDRRRMISIVAYRSAGSGSTPPGGQREGADLPADIEVGTRLVIEGSVTLKRPSVALPKDGPFAPKAR